MAKIASQIRKRYQQLQKSIDTKRKQPFKTPLTPLPVHPLVIALFVFLVIGSGKKKSRFQSEYIHFSSSCFICSHFPAHPTYDAIISKKFELYKHHFFFILRLFTCSMKPGNMTSSFPKCLYLNLDVSLNAL
jgi:hypothetical protein